MAKFGTRSNEKLMTVHLDLQRLFREVVKHYDCAVICGRRGEEEQNEYYRTGTSKLKFPQSKHNKTPSLALDVCPYPIDWNDKDRFYHFAGLVKGIAISMEINIRWGGNWDGDNDLDDQTFFDLPHFELIN